MNGIPSSSSSSSNDNSSSTYSDEEDSTTDSGSSSSNFSVASGKLPYAEQVASMDMQAAVLESMLRLVGDNQQLVTQHQQQQEAGSRRGYNSCSTEVASALLDQKKSLAPLQCPDELAGFATAFAEQEVSKKRMQKLQLRNPAQFGGLLRLLALELELQEEDAHRSRMSEGKEQREYLAIVPEVSHEVDEDANIAMTFLEDVGVPETAQEGGQPLGKRARLEGRPTGGGLPNRGALPSPTTPLPPPAGAVPGGSWNDWRRPAITPTPTTTTGAHHNTSAAAAPRGEHPCDSVDEGLVEVPSRYLARVSSEMHQAATLGLDQLEYAVEASTDPRTWFLTTPFEGIQEEEFRRKVRKLERKKQEHRRGKQQEEAAAVVYDQEKNRDEHLLLLDCEEELGIDEAGMKKAVNKKGLVNEKKKGKGNKGSVSSGGGKVRLPTVLMSPHASNHLQQFSEDQEDLSCLYWEATKQCHKAAEALAVASEHLRQFNTILRHAPALETEVAKGAARLRVHCTAQEEVVATLATLTDHLEDAALDEDNEEKGENYDD